MFSHTMHDYKVQSYYCFSATIFDFFASTELIEIYLKY